MKEMYKLMDIQVSHLFRTSRGDNFLENFIRAGEIWKNVLKM